MAVATSFSVKNVESAEFMTIISPASARAAMSELRAMYMQFSGMLRHPVEVPDFVPHPAIRIERQAANGNPGDEVASGGEELIHQALILGEEEDIAHEPAEGNSSIRFSGPCSRKNRAEIGAAQFSPALASSPEKGVPNAWYPRSLRRALLGRTSFGRT